MWVELIFIGDVKIRVVEPLKSSVSQKLIMLLNYMKMKSFFYCLCFLSILLGSCKKENTTTKPPSNLAYKTKIEGRLVIKENKSIIQGFFLSPIIAHMIIGLIIFVIAGVREYIDNKNSKPTIKDWTDAEQKLVENVLEKITNDSSIRNKIKKIKGVDSAMPNWHNIMYDITRLSEVVNIIKSEAKTLKMMDKDFDIERYQNVIYSYLEKTAASSQYTNDYILKIRKDVNLNI